MNPTINLNITVTTQEAATTLLSAILGNTGAETKIHEQPQPTVAPLATCLLYTSSNVISLAAMIAAIFSSRVISILSI